MRMPLGYFLGTEIHGFFKDTAWLRIDIIHGTSWLRLAGASSRLSLLCTQAYAQPSRVYTLYSLKANQVIPIAQPSRAFYLKAVSIRA